MPQRNLHVNCHVNGATSQSGLSSLWVSGCKIKIKNESERASDKCQSRISAAATYPNSNKMNRLQNSIQPNS